MIAIGIQALVLSLLVAQTGGTPDTATGETPEETPATYQPAEVAPSPSVDLEGPASLPPPIDETPVPAEPEVEPEPAVEETPAPAAKEGLPPPSKPRLLVMELVDKGAGREVTNAINEAIANQAIQSHVGEVVTYEQLRVTMEASAMQQMLGCDADGCMASLGETVEAAVVLGGNVAKVGDDVLITLVAIRPEDGHRVGAQQRKVPLHKDLYYYAARQLTSLVLTGRSVDPTVPVMIAASEAGAAVMVDGRDVGEAPVTIPLDPGSHEVVVRLEGFATWKTSVVVEEATPLSVTATLVASGFPLWPIALTFGGLSVASGIGATAVALLAYDSYFGWAGVVVGGPEKAYANLSPASTAELKFKERELLYYQIAEVSLWVLAGGFAAIGIGVETADLVGGALLE